MVETRRRVELGDLSEGFVTTGRAAQLAGVSVDTILRWCTNGRLPYRQLGPNAHRRIHVKDLTDVLSGDGPTSVVKPTHSTLAEVAEAWADALAELSPFEPSVADSPKHLMAMLVALRGNSRQKGMGGLIGAATMLAGEIEEALEDKETSVLRSSVQERALQGLDLDADYG